MDKLLGLSIVVLIAIIKLVVTGVCLAIGFRLGAQLYDMYENRKTKKLTTIQPA